MTKQKWQSFYGSFHQERKDSYAEYFKAHLIEHLTSEVDPNGKANQPGKIIEAARNTVGKLSRIFDEYNFPAPAFNELKAIAEKPNGLREHMRENLNGVMPALLNEERTALHPKVIEAIGADNYQAILKNAGGDEQEVAMQFVKAVFISYGQRMMDNTEDPKLKSEAFFSVMPALEKLSSEVTLKDGLPEQAKKTNTVDLQKMSGELLGLLHEAKQAGVIIPNNDLIRDKLTTVQDIMNPDGDFAMLPEETKIQKATESYDKAVDGLVKGIQETLATEVPKPKEVCWFKKILRQITGNEKLLQNTDEKRYDRQMTVLSELGDLNKKLNALPEEKDHSSEMKEMPDLEQRQQFNI